jgi:hypothetical protein
MLHLAGTRFHEAPIGGHEQHFRPSLAAPASPHRGPAPTAAEIATDQRRRSRMHGAPPATRRVESKQRRPRPLRDELSEQEE